MHTTRREFVTGMAIAGVAPAAVSSAVLPSTQSRAEVSSPRAVSVRVRDNRVYVETATLSAIIDAGFVASLKSKATGQEFIGSFDVKSSPALQIVYRSDEGVGIDESRFGEIRARQLAPDRAEVFFHCWDGDGLLFVTADPDTGDLICEPSAVSSRPGARACRWSLRALQPDLEFVAPLYQGVRLKLDDPLTAGRRWAWPAWWEAGFAIFQGATGGFWVHSRDNRYRYKAVKIGSKADPRSVGFDTEAYGPLDNNLSAGGLAWRLNVYEGDWKVPAARYRDWAWDALGLRAAERKRKEWIHKIRLAISWCPGESDILEALARSIKPREVLLHFPNWRTDPYDENYPDFNASQSGRAFVSRAREMGYHVMPHFNAIDIDPTNPVYQQVREFQYRDVETGQLKGWSWYRGRSIGVPESNAARTEHRDMKVMVKIHPALALWRSVLCNRIAMAAADLSLETVFVDVVLNTFNLHNCLVDGVTSSEGMNRLVEEIGALGDGLVVAGEGLNETMVSGISFGQAHLFESWQTSLPGLERTGGVALNEFLFGKVSRTFGYSSLGGRNPDEELRMRIHAEHGAIPTITINSAAELANPKDAVRKILSSAGL